ncbi:MAG: hypothetical protein LBU24_01585 [Methanocalculaceae archaeon]|jgi:hypothetical protein|nr:hypothetical protein [Methanocalculaceae archaeon]
MMAGQWLAQFHAEPRQNCRQQRNAGDEVDVYNGDMFTMSGGEISGNTLNDIAYPS